MKNGSKHLQHNRIIMETYIELSAQARNQDFCRAGEVSWNKGTSINIHLYHTKEKPHRENSRSILLLDIPKFTF